MTDDASTHDRARQPGAPTTWGRTLAALLELARGLGLDPELLRAALGLDAAHLRDPDARVSLSALYELLEQLIAQSGDEHAALRLARSLDVESFDALGLLVRSSATLGEALERTIRYQRVFTEGERYELERTDGLVHVRYRPWGPPRLAHVAMADLFARDLGVNVAALLGEPIPGVQVRLRRAPPRDRERWQALLGVRVELGAPIDEVVLPAAALSIEVPRADPVMARFFERYLDARLARLSDGSWLERVRRAVYDLLPAGEATLAGVARRMRASERTVQRRLAGEGATFGDLVEDVRRARSLALIDAGVSIAGVAWLVGYSEPSAFHRAFRRWTGMTPRQWRARTRA